jgi:sugar O-acyltransferase (sialic acid O-acetyltransferase NeuD family)
MEAGRAKSGFEHVGACLMKPLVIYGASYPDVVKLIDKINAQQCKWEIIGFLDDVKKNVIDSFMGYPIIGGEKAIPVYLQKGCHFIINVSNTSKNKLKVIKKLEKYQVQYATLISPEVDICYSEIGLDCMIMDGVKLGANIQIGDHVAIRLNSTLNHDCVIEQNVFIGPGVTICGGVKIMEGAWIGAGAIIKNDIVIQPWCTVGMGSVVQKSMPAGDVVAAPPARSIKNLIK